MKKLSILLLLALLPAIGYSQNGKFDVRLSFGEYTCSPEKITVLVEVKSSSSGTSFAMGDATMRFDYKLSEVVNPVLKTQHNFSSAATPRDFNYQPLTISNAEAGDDGILTLNITYAGLVDGAKNVSTDWISVATLEFDLRSANKCVELKWHDNTRTPITGMSEIITPGSQPVAQAITGTQFLDMSYCVTDYLPTATISASPTSITQGESSTLSVTLTAGTGNWSATLSDGNTVSNSSNSVATFSVSPTTTTTYIITSLTDECRTNAFLDGAPEVTIGVIADEDPCQSAVLPTATISASPTSITQGQSSTLTVSLTGGTGNWSATLSNGSTVSNAANTLSVSPTTTTAYAITSLTDECRTNAFLDGAPEVTIGVIADEDPCQSAVLPTATISASPNSIIEGESSTLTVSLTGGTGNWSATLSNGSTVSNAANTLSVSPTTTTTYTITSLTDECRTNAFLDGAPEVTIGVIADEDPCQSAVLPTATISASPSSIIQGESSTLTVSLTGGTGNWSATLSNGSTVSNSANTLSVSPTTTTAYTVTSLTDACRTNAYATNAPEVTIGVIADENPCQSAVLPTATISASPNSIIEGESSTLTVSLTGGTGNWSAILSNGSTVSNAANTLSVSPTTTTAYTVTSLTDACRTNAYAVNAPEVTIGVIADENCVAAPCLPITFKIIKK